MVCLALVVVLRSILVHSLRQLEEKSGVGKTLTCLLRLFFRIVWTAEGREEYLRR